MLLILSLILTLSGAASAGVIYPDLTSFLDAVQPGYYLENFNALGIGSHSSPMGFSANGYSYSASAAGGLYTGPWAGDGSLFGAYVASRPVTFTFTSGNVTAVGGWYFVTNASNAVRSGTVTLNFSDGTSQNVASSPVSFLGYVSDVPLTSLTISGPAGLFVSLDDFYVGTAQEADATPEPVTWTLLAAGCLLFALRKRKHA
jgi:hypothetical protein